MPNNAMKIRFGKNDLILETGKIAKQANGSVTVRYGGTVVLVTACMSREAREGRDFFPLTVEYQEKTYAAGRIPGGFFKREGRPSESEILTARLIDRPHRPLFPKGLFNDVQVMAIVLSSDGENDPDVLSVVGASVALSISDIPFNGPLACCRVARIDNEFILNPTYTELEKSELDVVIAANAKGIIMLESKAREISEETFKEAVKFGFQNLQDIIKLEDEFIRQYGKPKADIEYKKIDPELEKKIEELSRIRLKEIYNLTKKEERQEGIDLLSKELQAQLTEEGYSALDIKMALLEVEREQIRKKILEENVRIDGRGFKDIRPISCEVSVLPRTHGSSLFTRGQTQSLAITTLGTGDDEQLIEALEGERYKTFMLHYSFPPFSVGETKPVRGPGRREIGHGVLAERSLLGVMPSKESFPYTIRVVSEILESNGSSSMATVCAATLSLMDAGVPIKDAVGGVALGLIKEGEKAIILTDITGLEDHFGDLDFKVAGTKTGITAVQVDLKIDGIDLNLLDAVLTQAKEARFFVLDKMKAALDEPRQELSSYAPRIQIVKVNPEKIGELIGPSGKTIKKIIASTGVNIDIQDDGNVLIASVDASKSKAAIDMIKAITEDVEVGRIYVTKVKRIVPFGVFCEIAPGKDGLVHVSELADRFVKNVEDIVKIGDEIKVKVIGIDELGRINLSKKQVEGESNCEKKD
ncbi:MAG: polyribonucleotide nucleotidyltransferase [Candidatus Omnitrophica bacterium]|nr:polyribonucleotide nucleotidyltransferase [Candidatus Omnitrophota bacterium]MCG2706338.1 polyribonucleotide nucleotidyltransferase [Candidatus Omnitrophota bacterium]